MRTPLALLAALGCACAPADREPAPSGDLGQSRQEMADTSKEDVFAEAPYRVESLDTVVPVDVVISDAHRAGIAIKTFYLNSVAVSVLQGGVWKEFYRRDFGGFDVAATGATNNMFLLHVTEGLGTGLVDGKPITPRNLGATTEGQVLDLKVVVDASGGKGDDLKQIHLRTRVGVPLPHHSARFAGWLAGDVHAHTMYTNNWAEFGLPHRALLHAGHSAGLDWISTADHSNDLDATCDGRAGFFGDNVSTLVADWTFCENAQAMPCTRRSHIGVVNGWLMADDDAKDAESWAASFADLKFHTGEEVTLNSAAGKTVHALAIRTGYVEAKGSGAAVSGVRIDCDEITMTLPTLLSLAPANGFVYAAHPTQPLKPGINGGAWEQADYETALASPRFAGFQLWNTHITGINTSVNDPQDSGGLDPYSNGQIGPPCDPAGAECHPHYLLQTAIPLWDTWLSKRCASNLPGPFAAAGSDSHGDFNFTTTSEEGLTVDSADDNALARVRTVALAPSGKIDDILDAVRDGRTVLTDGPMVAFGIDRTGDGTIDQADQDVQVGGRLKVPAKGKLSLVLKWETTSEFGGLGELRLVRGDETTSNRPPTYQVFETDPEKLSADCGTASRDGATCTLEISRSASFGLPAPGKTVYFRIEAATGNGQYLALTNPIWLEGVDCADQDGDGYAVGPDCSKLPEFAGKAVDCDDTNEKVNPGVLEESCINGVDNDCDGVVDDCPLLPAHGCSCGNAGLGVDAALLPAVLASLLARRRGGQRSVSG